MYLLRQNIRRLLLPVMLLVVSSVAAQGYQSADQPHKRVRDFSWMSAAQWEELHQANVQSRGVKPAAILFQGDSITNGWLHAGKPVWDSNYAEQGAANYAISGDTTQNLLWRITEGGELDGVAPDVIVLLIGSNNFVYSRHTPEQVATGVKAIVNEFRARQPAASIILLGILPRGAEADNPLRERIQQANQEIAQLGDNDKVYYLYFGDRFLQADGSADPALMHDSVHLTEQGYGIWAAEMAPLLERLLNNDT